MKRWIMILALTSTSLSPGQIYDAASSVIEQKMSQIDGIGDVQLSGSSLPAVRVELNPRALFTSTGRLLIAQYRR